MWRIILDEYRNLIALIVIVMLLTVPYMQKRKGYVPRLIIGTAACFALVLLYIPLHELLVAIDSDAAVVVLSVTWYLFVVCLVGGLVLLCYEVNFTELAWIMITAYAVQHIVYVVAVEFVFFGLLGDGRNLWGQVGMSVLVAAVIYPIVFLLFVPNMRKREHLYFRNSWQNALALMSFFVVFFATTFVNQSGARGDGNNIISMISDFANCLFVIIVQYVSLRTARMKREKEALAIQLENETKRYESFRNAVEYINVKCHDLKFELASAQRSGGIDTERFDEITENIAVYESFAKTGNAVLDALLTDTNFICKNNGISFSCMADASGFGTMKNEDIYCIFGNILENAIDYVRTVADKDKRFIRLFIKSQGDMKIVHQENYFDGKLLLSGGGCL